MIILISPAKTMLDSATQIQSSIALSEPRFLQYTQEILSLMQGYNSEEIAEIFKVSVSIACELRIRFDNLQSFDGMYAALDGYDGMVYKHFKREFSKSEVEYLQKHLRISSLLYGLLRPYDSIMPYRMEGFVRLAGSDERVDRFWRDIQTQTLIEDVQKSGGKLVYLASKEEQNSFHWKKVKKAVDVIDIQFLQYTYKNGIEKLRQVVIYTKMARGEMVRYAIDNQITDMNKLKEFEWKGYTYREDLSTDSKWIWVLVASQK